MSVYLIQVPASSTNLGAGFDSLGLALGLYLKVKVRESAGSTTEIEMEGEGEKELVNISDNLIWNVIQRVFHGENKLLPPLHLTVHNSIPLARGLGSSAAAIVAGLGSFEALVGQELTQEKFFRYALEFENHPDNITAARFGGFTISCISEKGEVCFSRTEISHPLKLQAIVPDFQVATTKARAIIPQHFNINDVIFNLQRTGLTVAALMGGQFQFMHESLRDRIHQPYRASLIPGLEEILRLNEKEVPDLLGVSLSGAGPSVLTFFRGNGQPIFQRIQAIFNGHGVVCRLVPLEIDNLGRSIHIS